MVCIFSRTLFFFSQSIFLRVCLCQAVPCGLTLAVRREEGAKEAKMPKYEYERHERTGLMGRLASFFRSAMQRFNLKDEMEYLSERLEHLSDRIERFTEEEGRPSRARTTTKRVSRPAVAARRAGGAKKAKKPVPPEVSAKKSAAGKKGAAVRWGKVSKKSTGTKAKKTTGTRAKKSTAGRTTKAKKEQSAAPAPSPTT